MQRWRTGRLDGIAVTAKFADIAYLHDFEISVTDDQVEFPTGTEIVDAAAISAGDNIEGAVRVTLPGTPTEHDADQVDGNTFVWVIDEDDFDSTLLTISSRRITAATTLAGGRAASTTLLYVGLVIAAAAAVVSVKRHRVTTTDDPHGFGPIFPTASNESLTDGVSGVALHRIWHVSMTFSSFTTSTTSPPTQTGPSHEPRIQAALPASAPISVQAMAQSFSR